MALQWVQENIGAFGGDKRQVMVYGESAGAGSVSNHLVMSKSFPYYSSAIMESGSFSEWITQPLSMAQTAYETLLVEVKCGDVDCLLKKPAEEIYQASLLIASTNVVYGTPYNPTVDGVELFTHPWISVAEGDVADVPILHGANLDEGSMFVPLPYDVQEAGLAAYWSAYLDEGIRILLNLYVTGDDVPDYPSVTVDGVRVSDYWWAADRSMADGSFYCSAKYASMELSRQQQQKENKRESSTYLYHFDYLADGSDVPFVQHTNEIPFMLHDNSYMDSKADFTMADTVAGYWGSFLSQHNPNSNNNPADATKPLPMWEAYMLREDNLLKMQGPGAVAEATGVNRKECDFFIPWTDAALKAMFPAPFHYP